MARKTVVNGTVNRSKKAATSTEPPATTVVSGVRKNLKPFSLDEEIRLRAYELYLERGGRPGDEHDDWLSAEREIRARYQARTA